MKTDYDSCVPCGIHKLSRNTYFNGKLLVERDFKDEQIYHVLKQRTLNSVLHGRGTVCGLKVVAHPAEECRDEYVVVEPGLALDCCGREIIVPAKALVSVRKMLEAPGFSGQLDGDHDLFIAICYKEMPGELVPVVLPDCECDDRGQAPNRIDECYEFHLFTQRSGDRVEEQPPIRAKVDWSHTITLARQSPRAVATDDEFRQIYLAALATSDDGIDDGLTGARIYAYRQDNHDLITALNGGTDPVDLAVSGSGELVYLAGAGLAVSSDDDGVEGVAVYRESEMRTRIDPAAVMDLGGPVRLAVSPRSDALFALHLSERTLSAWSEDAVNDWVSSGNSPVASAHTLADVLANPAADDGNRLRNGASLIDVSLDGRFLFIADPEEPGDQCMRVVSVAKLFADDATALVEPAIPGVDPGERAVAVKVSRDSRFLHLLTRDPSDGAPVTRLRRFEWRVTEQTLVAAGRGGEWASDPLDLTLAPNEKWAYVLQFDSEETDAATEVAIVSVSEISSALGGEPVNPVSEKLTISGRGRFERLTTLGERLYLAADDQFVGDQPERGLVAVLDVEGADCGDLFLRPLEGCPTCDEASDRDCVVLAHLPGYLPLQPMEDAERAGESDAVIDNVTYRPLVTSNQNITEVIRCMLDEGAVAGTPGPRGASGSQGDRGPSGPGIEAIGIAILPSGDPPTAALTSIPGDPEGDRRLDLGIPAGEAGPRGPGITAIVPQTLPPGSSATAVLNPIPGDPEGDFSLTLGVPQGAPGAVIELDLGHVVALSWTHGRESFPGVNQFLATIKELGLVIGFDRPVLVEPVITREIDGEPRSVVFELLAREEGPDKCWCPLDLRCEPIRDFQLDPDGRIINIDPVDPDDFPEFGVGFRLIATRDLRLEDPRLLRVIFRADFALDERGQAIDGNHVGGLVPSRPSGSGSQGGAFDSWFSIRS